MRRTLKIIGDIIAEPSAAFRVLKDQPSWFMIFVIIALVSIGIAWAILPFSEQIAHTKMLETGMDASQIEQARGMEELLSLVGLLFTPVPLLLKWLIFAGLLYFSAQLLGGSKVLTFKPMFAAVVYSELILVFSNLINAGLLLCFKDISDVRDSIDLQMIPGLHLLFGDHPLGVLQLTLLSQITPFSIWYLVILSLGVAIVADLKRRKVEWLVVLVWLASIGVRAATSVF
ncbi:MAG: YIP1 family protein [Candidatus Poribacteria bacterium]|nr:YIP1 family protein [Candidatus Poribacteria bacterium]